ncbi:MAG TPA: branched-chain amino acid transaminase [Xanthomonadales bacterium]|nr:branched-chain amino acid transaminase [Xanthomonadales bacterium]
MVNYGKIWFNGEIRDESECTVSVASHALHYGTSVFEGIRGYKTPQGTAIFRLTDHLERMYFSASIYRMPVPYDLETLHQACRDTVRINELESAYIRPIVLRGNCGIGVIPKDMNMVDTAIITTAWGAYLGEDGLKNGIKACITSWNRLAPNTMPPGSKAGGNYLSSLLIGLEARERGCIEGIGLGVDGLLSEGAGENIFIVEKERIVTPPVSSSILAGITRDTVTTLAKERGLEVVEQSIAREQMYAADEIFMTGTAAEVTPVSQLDHIVIGNGGCGPVTKQLQNDFFGLFNGSTKDRWGWLEYV